MADLPRFTMIPAPRCSTIKSSSPLVICNRPAHWMPLLASSTITPFRCDEHRSPGDMPIAGFPIVRRVSVVSQIILCSQLESDLLARAEALARLDRGIAAVGGLLSLHTVNCQTGPWAVPLASGDEIAKGGGG